jgi:chromosome segregation ATPase
METSELTKIATAHQAAISRHDEEMAEIRAILRQGFARSEQAIAQHEQAIAQHDREMAAIRAQQQLNAQALAQFTAGLEELRILVADHLRGRESL